MSDGEALALPRRVGAGLRRSANWWELVRFVAVGGSGYVINLATYALAVHALGLDYRVAAVLAFLVAVSNNFVLNRHWTFGARDGHAGFQAARFFVVSVTVFLVQLGLLLLLVETVGLGEVPGQALAIFLCTPLNFLGNKLWSFGR
jgi:dolichol-phosphate mannosyltransferase